ncbi:MAG: A/G-specific adenine glycosylase [Sulfuricellaceae bacterium]
MNQPDAHENRAGFASRLTAWQCRHGRHDLPWQGSRDPYAVWLSEIMLQQTQVATVIPYYLRFTARFPDIAALAAATEDEVLVLWSGLGYYSRARNLHRAAQLVMARHGGELPRDFAAIQALPGIGRSTAAAIAAFAFGSRRAILDGNVKRVLARCFGIAGHPGGKAVENALWALAEQLLPTTHIESYTQGLMDLGASLCGRNRPRCGECPLRDECIAHLEGRTAELPTRKSRPPLPEKETALLMLLRDGEILLEKRPPTGIWGGLWSLPEIGLNDDPAQAALARFGVETEGFLALPPVRHTFTHFRLLLHPLVADALGQRHEARQSSALWLALPDALGAALPAPVRKLLERLDHGQAA